MAQNKGSRRGITQRRNGRLLDSLRSALSGGLSIAQRKERRKSFVAQLDDAGNADPNDMKASDARVLFLHACPAENVAFTVGSR